tara:strand:+ start:269 stop:511 length:243 start_codon:yes stop_codon:yes gene_type:complete
MTTIRLSKHSTVDPEEWVPDGIVLSKLESSSGDLEASKQFDSQHGELFNIGIQGPAITTVWTSDSTTKKRPACLPGTIRI